MLSVGVKLTTIVKELPARLGAGGGPRLNVCPVPGRRQSSRSTGENQWLLEDSLEEGWFCTGFDSVVSVPQYEFWLPDGHTGNERLFLFFTKNVCPSPALHFPFLANVY